MKQMARQKINVKKLTWIGWTPRQGTTKLGNLVDEKQGKIRRQENFKQKIDIFHNFLMSLSFQ